MSTTQKLIKIFAYLLAISIIVAICSGIINTINVFMPTTEKIVVEDYYKEFKNIKRLEMNINAADLTIEAGEIFSIKANNLISKIKVQEEDGTLKVKQNKIRTINKSAGSIIITIPEELKSFTLNGGAGKVDITDLKAKKVKLSLGFGNLDMSNVNFSNIVIKGGAGNIKVEKSILKDLDLSAGAGKIIINSELQGNSKIECGLGDVEVFLIGGEDNYKIKAEKGLGNITINNKNYGDKITYGNGKSLVNIEGGMGNIDIRFLK